MHLINHQVIWCQIDPALISGLTPAGTEIYLNSWIPGRASLRQLARNDDVGGEIKWHLNCGAL